MTNVVNVFETIEHLFAQVSQDLMDMQRNASLQEIATVIESLKTRVICTVAISNQQYVSHVTSSLQDMKIPLQNGELRCEPK